MKTSPIKRAAKVVEDELEEGEMDCPCPCAECGRWVELNKMYGEESNLVCKKCYEENGGSDE